MIIQWFLHQKFYSLIPPKTPLLSVGAIVRMTGCRTNGSSTLRLLPTDRCVFVLKKPTVSFEEISQKSFKDLVNEVNSKRHARDWMNTSITGSVSNIGLIYIFST